MGARTAIGAALAAGALALAAPAGTAIADGPGGGATDGGNSTVNSVFTNYTDTLNAVVAQYTDGRSTPQQFGEQIAAADAQLSAALQSIAGSIDHS
jgi:hypothetical protein